MPSATPIDHAKVEFFMNLERQLNQATRAERRALLASAIDLWGKSKKTIYQWLTIYGGRKPDRKRRADAGTSIITEEGAQFVATLLVNSIRKNNKQTMSVNDAVEIAQAQGMLDLSVTPENMRRVLRQRRLTPKVLTQPAPHVQMKSLHPNHVWQFDVSTCLMYYIEGAFHDMNDVEHYKNKPDNVVKVEKYRVQRYLITDHCSGSIFCRYYLAPGESSAVLFDFLMEAFSHREDFLMHGVPLMLIWDAGSANTSREIQNVLDALGVEHRAHLPGNPRAKGQVEKHHDIVEKSFESRLRLTQITGGVDQLNQLLDVWQKDFNSTRIHSRHLHTRSEVWQRIRPEQLRLAPEKELCRLYLNGVAMTRNVKGDRTIQYSIKKGQSYRYCLQHTEVCVGDSVQVIPNAFLFPDIVVEILDEKDEPRRYRVSPIEFGEYGFATQAVAFGEEFGRQPDTRIEHQRKARDLALYGTTDHREAEKIKHSGVAAFNGEVDAFSYLNDRPQPEFMQRPGTALHLPHTASPELKPLDHIEALKLIRHALGRSITVAENQQVKAWYPDGVPEQELAEITDRLRRRATAGPQSKAGGE